MITFWDEVFWKLMHITDWFRRIGEIRKHKRMEEDKKELLYRYNRQFYKVIKKGKELRYEKENLKTN